MLRLNRCTHRFSWPRRLAEGEYYQVCLICGDEYGYDWKSMRRLDRLQPAQSAMCQTSEGGGSRCERSKKAHWVPRSRRIKVEGQVILFRCYGATSWRRAVIENISSSGVLFHSSEPMPINTDVEMILEMPTEITGQKNSRVLAMGMIVRTEPVGPGAQSAIVASIASYEFLRDKNPVSQS